MIAYKVSYKYWSVKTNGLVEVVDSYWFKKEIADEKENFINSNRKEILEKHEDYNGGSGLSTSLENIFIG